MTSDAFRPDDTRLTVLAKGDRLMTAVLTGYIASSTADTFFAVNLGEYHRLAVEVMRQYDVVQLFAYQFL